MKRIRIIVLLLVLLVVGTAMFFYSGFSKPNNVHFDDEELVILNEMAVENMFIVYEGSRAILHEEPKSYDYINETHVNAITYLDFGEFNDEGDALLSAYVTEFEKTEAGWIILDSYVSDDTIAWENQDLTHHSK